jgi:hypothetical protein
VSPALPPVTSAMSRRLLVIGAPYELLLGLVGNHEESKRTVMGRLVDGSSGTGKPAEFTRKSNHRVGVRPLRAVNADGIGADRLHELVNGFAGHNYVVT